MKVLEEAQREILHKNIEPYQTLLSKELTQIWNVSSEFSFHMDTFWNSSKLNTSWTESKINKLLCVSNAF